MDRDFFFNRIQTGSGFHPAFCQMSAGSLFGVKWPEHKADYSPPFNAEVKNV
jgi:hypothetical protein